ncbi:hypothetical protein [uncultured Dietzia sp.]|uniref:hypothetical protein n=1 Tax=uncultured Dietzia sp. TaxID=395519 RepID=UPI00342BDAA1
MTAGSWSLPRHRTEVRLARYTDGLPVAENFEFARVLLPPLSPGQILVRNLLMSVDPSMRIRMTPDPSAGSYLPPFALGRALEGWAVGEVLDSHHSGFRPGDHVTHVKGWRDVEVLDPGSRGYRDPRRNSPASATANDWPRSAPPRRSAPSATRSTMPSRRL